jgi:hypothetical protein
MAFAAVQRSSGAVVTRLAAFITSRPSTLSAASMQKKFQFFHPYYDDPK